MKDIVYIYNKITFSRQELGEIQTNFNLSFVIDGTKDSAKMLVHNFSDEEVEPYSIIKHKATNTWWVVSHDRVDRYENESGYYYVHELELLGAIELLNARDLTDCGFNQNRYNVREVIEKILRLSTFEFNKTTQFTITTNSAIDLDKNVDYVKTFENYTLLSALREFIEGYNCAIKLDFVENSIGTLIGANFNIISKTGNVNGATYTESDFNKVEQVKTMDKNSFGTSVVSNAENVVSTKAKTYPTNGTVRVTGTEANITNSTAVVRLPSNIFRVNWVEFVTQTMPVKIYTQSGQNISLYKESSYMPLDDKSMADIYAWIKTQLGSLSSDFESQFSIDELPLFGRRRFYYTDKYDRQTDKYYSEHAIPIRMQSESIIDGTKRQTVLSNSEIWQSATNQDDVIYFERGKNLIKGFGMFGDQQFNRYKAYFVPTVERVVYQGTSGSTRYYVAIGNSYVTGGTIQTIQMQNLVYTLSQMGVRVNYVPMSDIKVKLDNTLEKRDSQYFNQNGKLTDSVALSKLLLSHSKEIESDNITKNAVYYYKYSNGVITHEIPSIGSLVAINNQSYVINNVSLTFNQNEVEELGTDIEYFVTCEFTLSKYVAVKSLMTNSNQNIRDYGIPQNNNVARKQLYRDFYELGYTQESSNTSWYLSLDKILNIYADYKPYQEHIAVIRLDFKGAYGGGETTTYSGENTKITINVDPSNTWYYQLESTTFVMKKSIYEIFNFNDNNIIGYGSQNVWSGFDIRRVIWGMLDIANTPISYVDNNGEVENIKMYLCTNEQITRIYENYKNDNNASGTYYNYNFSCFIPSDIIENNTYGAKLSNNHDFIIGHTSDEQTDEPNYEKDALEVPVFEYSCQIDDSDKVIIGSNVLDTFDLDRGYMYSYIFVDKNKYNDNNYSLKKSEISTPTIDENNVATITNAVKMEYDNNQVKITLWGSCTLDLTKPIDNITNPTYSTQKSFDTTKDLMIVRSRIMEEDLIQDIVGELISNSAYTTLPSASIDYINEYAVKTDDNYYMCEIDQTTISGTLYSDITTLMENELSGVVGRVGEYMCARSYLSDTFYHNLTHDTTTITGYIGGQTYNDTVASCTIEYTYDVSAHYQRLGSVNSSSTIYDTQPIRAVFELSGHTFIIQNIDVTITGKTPSSTEAHIDNYFVNPDNPSQIIIDYYIDLYIGTNATVRFGIDELQPAQTGLTRQVNIQGNKTQYQSISVENPSYETITSYSLLNTNIVSTPIGYYLYMCLDQGNPSVWDIQGKVDLSTITNQRYIYGNKSYNWNTSQNTWTPNTTYVWTQIDNASGKYFTYENDILRYNSITNDFELISGNINNRQDLMFICRDMAHAPISSNELSLFINYYKTH